MSALPGLVAVIPAVDEEATIGAVVRGLRARGVGTVLVGDNGSRDRTAEVAAAAGAIVVCAPQRGYGAACRSALRAVPPGARAIVFCDADGADDLDRLLAICVPVLAGEQDLVVGSRALGTATPGALSLPQRFGNRLSTFLLRWRFGVQVTDLGPFRCIDAAALAALDMQDRGFGWTVEMQAKVLQRGLRYAEVPVDAQLRRGGTSKISGNLRACVRAGLVILTTIWRHRQRLAVAPATAKSGTSLRMAHRGRP